MIQIISYIINRDVLTVAFKINEEFVIYSSIPYDETKQKEELLQNAYEQIKQTVNYELTLSEHSITSDEDGEEFVPSPPAIKSLELDVENVISFEELEETKVITLTVKSKDQYGDDIGYDVITTFGTIENNELIIPVVTEKTDIVVTVTSGDKQHEETIEVYPYIPPNLDLIKDDKIEQTKQELARFLKVNPLLYNGEYYAITQEKQTLLTSAIASYQLKAQAEVPATLKWNTTGDVCREYTMEEIIGLVVAITDFVQPRIEKQQALEIQIKGCTTIDEVNAIEINYEVI